MTIALGIVGCGDVAFRTYFPGLAPIIADGSARVAVCFDPGRGAGEASRRPVSGRGGGHQPRCSAPAPGLNAAINLTPAPLHCEITTALINAGLDVFSEKPMAGSVEEGQD